jgi:copper oxidase (laccase) domain-containing protein
MADTFRCRPRDLRVGVGPAVGPCCYTVGDEVRRAFADHGRDIDGGDFLRGSDGRLRLNLPAAVIRQLLGAGIPAGNIETISLCTACRSDLLFSRRRDGPTPDRMHAFIAWID